MSRTRKARPHSKPWKKGQRAGGKPDRGDLKVRPGDGCNRPDKRHFRTASDAYDSIARIGISVPQLRAYRCRCGHWCLTSRKEWR